ncbi:hypothetical protein PS907_02631 [Pseudomonas fluorescens]|jgi:hypothetical protein|nr:hypothetical protein PS907_02631 [Pseudomonas fluorescens]
MNARIANMVVVVIVLLCGGWGRAVIAGPAEDVIGQEAVKVLRDRYNDTRDGCPNAPGIVCNGVLLRSTVPGPTFRFWGISPNAAKKNGLSFSYLRKDIKFDRTIRDDDNGYFVDPPIGNRSNKEDVNILCATPKDSWSDFRNEQGCGISANTGAVSASCETQGITTGAQWMTKFQADGFDNQKQCGFNLREGRGAAGVTAFKAFVDASKMLSPQPLNQQNEVILAIADPADVNNRIYWNDSSPKTLPLRALYFIPDKQGRGQGQLDAQYDQGDYCKYTGEFMPIVRLTLPKAPDQDATFTYDPADQKSCVAPAAVGKYIEKGEWISRYDPGTKQVEWSLALTPTTLGRNVRDDAETELVIAEIRSLFGKDHQWQSPPGRGASMREQLICHYLDARNKPVWNLEPFRPAATTAQSRQYGCNHL